MENTLRKSPWSAKSSIKSIYTLLNYLVCVAQRSNNVFCQAIIIKDYNNSQLKLALKKNAKPKLNSRRDSSYNQFKIMKAHQEEFQSAKY